MRNKKSNKHMYMYDCSTESTNAFFFLTSWVLIPRHRFEYWSQVLASAKLLGPGVLDGIEHIPPSTPATSLFLIEFPGRIIREKHQVAFFTPGLYNPFFLPHVQLQGSDRKMPSHHNITTVHSPFVHLVKGNLNLTVQFPNQVPSKMIPYK